MPLVDALGWVDAAYRAVEHAATFLATHPSYAPLFIGALIALWVAVRLLSGFLKLASSVLVVLVLLLSIVWLLRELGWWETVAESMARFL